jgi:protein associated with RNAse G/E
MRVYIDLGWHIHWSDDPLLSTGIDMDLDVIRIEGERPAADGPSGTWVDDRDEWAEHSIQLGYPADVMTHLEALTLDLETRVRAQIAPFDDATADVWLDRLEALDLAR